VAALTVTLANSVIIECVVVAPAGFLFRAGNTFGLALGKRRGVGHDYLMARVVDGRCGMVRLVGVVAVAGIAVTTVGACSMTCAQTAQAGVVLSGEYALDGVGRAGTQLMGARTESGVDPFFPLPGVIDAVAEKIGLALAEFASPPPVSVRAPVAEVPTPVDVPAGS